MSASSLVRLVVVGRLGRGALLAAVAVWPVKLLLLALRAAEAELLVMALRAVMAQRAGGDGGRGLLRPDRLLYNKDGYQD